MSMSFSFYQKQQQQTDTPPKKWWIRRHPFLTVILAFIFITCLNYWFSPDPEAGKSYIGVLPVTGPIFDSEETLKKLEILEKKDQVKGIIVRINSPGGGVAPSQEIYEEIKRVSKIKKTWASMSSLAASGGYYVAIGAEKIYANSGTLTGSIGVIMQFFNVEDLMQKVGISPVVIKAGKNKDIGSMYREMKPEERALMQDVIDNTREQFVSAIAEERKIERNRLDKIADGRIFSGLQAVEYGLVDETATFRETARLLAAELKLPEDFEIYEPELKKDTLTELLQSKLGLPIPMSSHSMLQGGLMAIWH